MSTPVRDETIGTQGQIIQLPYHVNACENVQDDAGEQHSASIDLTAKLKPRTKDHATIRCILSVRIFI